MPKWPSRKQPKPSSKATWVDPLCEGLSLSWVEGPITHKGKTSELGDLAFGRAKVCCTGSHGEGDEPKPMMNGREKSDPAVGAAKSTNEAGQPGEEWMEPRAGTKGNAA